MALQSGTVVGAQLFPAFRECLREELAEELRSGARFCDGDGVERPLGQIVPDTKVVVQDQGHLRYLLKVLL